MVPLPKTQAVLGAAALAAALLGCGDMVLAPPWEVGLSFEPASLRLDFGEVEAGTKQVLVLSITNRGNDTVRLVPGDPPPPPWSWDLHLAPGEEVLEVEGQGGLATGVGHRIEFGFAPGADREGVYYGEARLRGPDGDIVIHLQGRAIADPISCSPSALDFGRVVAGEERADAFRCFNRSSYPLWIHVPAPRHEVGSRFVVDRAQAELEVPPHDRLDISVRFLADGTPGPVKAVLPVRMADTREPLFPGEGLELRGHVVPSRLVQYGEEEGVPELDFGFVPVGQAAELSLDLRNLYDHPVRISAALEEERFAIVSVPGDLEAHPSPGGAVRLRFAPDAPGSVSDRLRLRIRRTDVPGVEHEEFVPVRAFGGGPEIDCDPQRTYDFGDVGVGAWVRGVISCRNVGPDLPTPEDDLVVLGVERQGHLFLPRLVPEEGGAFRVEVDYRPVAPGLDLDELTITSCGGAGCEGIPDDQRRPGHFRIRRIQLFGTGVHVPPCDAAFEPDALDFGLLGPAAAGRLGARLVNRGECDCLLSRLDGPGAPFALVEEPEAPLPPRDRGWILGPGESVHLPVEFASAEAGEFAAALGVYISNPSRPRLELPLRGAAGPSCLLTAPPDVDFTRGGDRAVDPAVACGAPDVRVTVWNSCPSETRRLEAVAPASGSAEGFLVSDPGNLPISLAPGTTHEILLDFRPTDTGRLHGGIRIEADGETLFLPVRGRAEEGGRWFDRFPLSQIVYPLSAPVATGPSPLAVYHLPPAGSEARLPYGWWTYDSRDNALRLERLELLELGGYLEARYLLGCEP